jgi:hypothetical protein
VIPGTWPVWLAGILFYPFSRCICLDDGSPGFNLDKGEAIHLVDGSDGDFTAAEKNEAVEPRELTSLKARIAAFAQTGRNSEMIHRYSLSLRQARPA